MQELYAETLVYENKSLPRFKLFTRSEVSPRKLAEYARGDFGLTLETQFGWENERVALTELVRLIESKGILVFQMTFNPKDARGFVLPDKNPPVIVMSASDSIRGRIFTLLHEYGHLLLGEEGISDWDDRNPVESFCNKFAADFLIPSGSLESHPAFLSFKNGIETDITQTIRNLVKDFKVSTEVILTALLKLGTISSYFYEEERARIAKEVEEYKKRKKRGGPTPAVNCVAQRGVPYVSAVISANKEGKIGLADVSDYLNVRQKHLPQIEGLILKKEKAYAAEAF